MYPHFPPSSVVRNRPAQAVRLGRVIGAAVFVALALLAVPQSRAQLAELQIEPVERSSPSVSLTDPKAAYVIIETDVEGLSVTSSLGELDVRKQGSEIQLKLAAGRQNLFFRAAGFRQATQSVSLQERDFQYFVVTGARVGTNIRELQTVFSIDPISAELIVDGISFGTNHKPILTLGDHAIEIRAGGYETVTANINVSATALNFEYKLNRQQPQRSFFQTTPAGATVYLNGEERGVTPFDAFLFPGVYGFEARLPGYLSITEDVEIAPGASNQFTYTLSQNVGQLVITTTVENALFRINDEVLGAQSFSRSGDGSYVASLDRAPGIYVIRGEADGHRDAEAVVEIRRGSSEQVTVNPEPIEGSLIVEVSPLESEVVLFRNGIETLRSQGSEMFDPVFAGTYEIEVSAVGYETQRQSVTVQEGQMARASIRLEEIVVAASDAWTDAYGRMGTHTFPGSTLQWATANLNVDTFSDGTPIAHAQSNFDWSNYALNGTPAWACFDNDPQNCDRYGKLYNGYAVADPRGLCPTDYVVAGDDDWARSVGSSAMAIRATTGWSENGAGRSTDFMALPGGYREVEGIFRYAGTSALFWTSTGSRSGYQWMRYVDAGSNDIIRQDAQLGAGMSVRCVSGANASVSRVVLPEANPSATSGLAGVSNQVAGELTGSDPTRAGGSPYDEFVVQAREGDQLFARMESSAFDTYLEIVRPDGSSWTNDDYEGTSVSQLDVTAESSGTFRIRATAYNSGGRGAYTLAYRVRPELNDQNARLYRESGRLSRGDVVDGNGKYVDQYSVSLSAGQRVRARMESSSFDTYLRVSGPSYSAYNDDYDGSTSVSLIDFEAPQSGTYTIEVTSYTEGATGAYSLTYWVSRGVVSTLQTTPAPGGRSATSGAGGSGGDTVRGSLSISDPTRSGGQRYDAYYVSASEGDLLFARMESSEFDTYLEILNPRGEVVGTNDDFEGGTSVSQLEVLADMSGRYEVRATAYSSGSGAYSLEYAVHEWVSEEGRLSSGDVLDGNGKYVDSFEVYLSSGQRVIARMTSDDFDTYLRLLGPNSDVVEFNDDFEGSTSESAIEHTASTSGSYTIQVTSYAAGATGRYTFMYNAR